MFGNSGNFLVANDTWISMVGGNNLQKVFNGISTISSYGTILLTKSDNDDDNYGKGQSAIGNDESADALDPKYDEMVIKYYPPSFVPMQNYSCGSKGKRYDLNLKVHKT